MKKNAILYVFFLVCLISINIFSFNFNLTNNEQCNTNEGTNISIRTSTSNPPNKLDFKYFKTITIHEGKVSGSGSYTNFPVLISILDSDLHDDVQTSGNDIAFANATDWLDHEIEFFNQTYNSTHAKLVTWVRLPSLSTSVDTTIDMYYGNTSMTSQENPANVWSTYSSVWHLKESSGIGDYLKDSTTNNYDGNPSGTQYISSGKIGGARNFLADSDGISITGGSNLLNGNNYFEFSFWMYPNYASDLEWKNDGEKDVFYKASSIRMARTWRADWQSANRGLFQADIQFVSYGTIFPNVQLYRRTWNHIVYFYDGYDFRVYVNGQEVWSEDIGPDSLISDSSTFILGSIGADCFNGYIDEFRISSSVNINGWYETEFNNQNDPATFFSLSSEVNIDNIPPFYSDLIESSDPLELGDTEIIKINVSDPSGINQVRIEYMGSNYSMTNISADTWQYDSWTPTSVDNYTYTIWMEDNYHNWNSTIGSIEVIDTTPPTYSDLIESADPLQFGQNETITIKVFDSPGSDINQTLLEYDMTNHTMEYIGGNTWRWTNWKPLLEQVYIYKIYMQDMQDNWNMTVGNITVITTTAPIIENLTESADPLELGKIISIHVDVYDTETNVSMVLIGFESVNYTMINIQGNTYEYNWTRASVGLILYKIYANDTGNNWNSYQASFDIVDTTPPTFSALFESDNPLELGGTITISMNSTDLSGINQVRLEFEGSNHSMSNIVGDMWTYNLWTPSDTGSRSYTIWIEDKNSNWNCTSSSFMVQDTTAPTYSNLYETPGPIELGTPLIISINVTDLAGIKHLLIEFENSNHTMTNVGGDIWQYSSWMPRVANNRSYRIFMEDNSNNLNSLNDFILFQDTFLPVYSNLIESSDPLELGNTITITIEASDFSGINKTLLEFEGSNHTMINIYGNTWRYDSWTPINWIMYQYSIFVQDKNGNWNFIAGNLTVWDTTPPSPPTLTNSPSGDVSGILVFDWIDGSDPSGILYYVLIIDTESNPNITPGYVFKINITNLGTESSYYELMENLNEGRYYFFLSQIDGTGHQSSSTMGTFTIVPINNGLGNTDFIIYIIIAVVLSSVGGSIVIIGIVRKKTQKKISPPRKKIPLKIILPHIIQISSPDPTLVEEKVQNFPMIQEENQIPQSEELPDEKDLDNNVEEIKALGEELFNEGAYLEAKTQFEMARDILMGYNRIGEAKMFEALIEGIEVLIEERDKILENLEQIKSEGNPVKIIEAFYDLIEISQKLKEVDEVKMYQSELTQYFKENESKADKLGKYRDLLEQRAESLYNDSLFEQALKIYEKCEKVSHFLVQMGKDEENSNVIKFREKKDECLKKK